MYVHTTRKNKEAKMSSKADYFSYDGKNPLIVSTALQKLIARVLYLAQCKIAGDQQPGAGFADLFRVINEEQNLHRDQAA
jgi:hypothetical protein